MNFNITSYIAVVVVVIIAFLNCLQVNCYSKVSKSGANYNQTDLPSKARPKIHQIFNTDIIFPRVFNTTMDESFEVSTANVESTGRANKYTGPFQFSSLNPSIRRPSTYSEVKLRPSISYPVYRPQSPNRAEIDKLRGKGTAMDRYTPGEAVATSFYKQNNKNGGYMYKSPPPKKETFPSQITSQDAYSPPNTKDLYAFPPNIDSSYTPPPLSSSGGKLQSEVSSYLPAPAGPAGPDDSYSGFVGPINPEYLPANFKISSVESGMVGKKIPIKISESNQNMNGNMHESEDQTPAPPQLMEDHQQVYSPQSDDDNDDDSRGPMPMDEHDNIPDDDNDDDHHHIIPSHDHDLHSHHGPWDFFGGHSINTFPELIYDDHHHHHQHHISHPVEVLTTTTTERPEPRVKKYSYFYLGRKLWYIPLYFTVWFSFYILFLILKSIARHKVNLPNHYQRRMMKRDLVQDINHQETVERVNRLNASVMAQIEAFKEKYL